MEIQIDLCSIRITLKPLQDWVNNYIQPKPNQKKFVSMLLSDGLFNIFRTSQPGYSRVINSDNSKKSHQAKARDYLLNRSIDGVPLSFAMHPDCRSVVEKWNGILTVKSIPPADILQIIHKILRENISDGPDAPALGGRIRERIEDLLADCGSEEKPDAAGERKACPIDYTPYAKALATLTLIGCTAFCWNDLSKFNQDRSETKEDRLEKQKNLLLYDLILPPSNSDQMLFFLNEAQKRIGAAGGAERSGTEGRELVRELERIAKLDVANSIRGQACYLLYLAYRLANNAASAEAALQTAAALGYPAACRTVKQNTQNQKAESLLENANRAFYAKQYKEAYRKCKELFALSPEPNEDSLLGNAAMMVYRCNEAYRDETENSLLSNGETPDLYLRKARDCGNREAEKLCGDRLGIVPVVSAAEELSEGSYYLNCRNALADLIKTSAPAGWQQCAADDPQMGPDSRQNRRYYFLEEDQAVNLHDALRLLESLRLPENSPQEGYCDSPEIYLRGQSEFLRPLVDTAVSRMNGRYVPVYIIDDDLWPAQWLLSRHPLFYPIRVLPADGTAALELVVIGNTRCAEWVVREAFSLMGFINDNVRCRITVIAPDAEQMEEALCFKCPGMAADVKVAGLSYPELVFSTCGKTFRTGALDQLVLDSYRRTTSCYFVVDAGDDAENLSLAARLRELLIRSTLFADPPVCHSDVERKERLKEPVPIAFHCHDPFTANLSRRLVTEQEDYGDQWYNSFCMIPFGADTDRYTWQNAAGGFFEDLAKNIHLQYSFVSADASISSEERRKLTREALAGYFRRSYNRESCMSVAVSLPYRLFQFAVNGKSHLTPPCWQITDTNAYCAELQLRALGLSVKDCLMHEKRLGKEEKKLSDFVTDWEHDRWSRWMLSRGWMPETIDQMLDCNEYGNPRHQFFLARLHPCICSSAHLKLVSQAWANRKEMKQEKEKNFIQYDHESVRQTAEILSRRWYGKETALLE